MISIGFAPNENARDARMSLKILFRPWSWKDTRPIEKVKVKLEKKFGFKASDIFFFLTGRSALFNLLEVLEHTPKSQIAVQAFTCEAVVLPIIAAKFRPLYIDIESESYSMDITSLESRMNSHVKAIILQHTFAIIPMHRERIINYAKKKGVVLIEDLAHGIDLSLTKHKNFEESVKLLSFGRSKSLSSVFGGAIVTSNYELKKKILTMQNSLTYPTFFFLVKALLYKPFAFLVKKTYSFYVGKLIHIILIGRFIPKEISLIEKNGAFDKEFNHRYPRSFASLLLTQLENYDVLSENRMKITQFYSQHFKDKYTSALLRYPLLLENRDAILKSASKKNIFLGNWYNQAVAPKDLLLSKVQYEKGSCKNAEEISTKILNLPTFVSLKQARRIVQMIDFNS